MRGTELGEGWGKVGEGWGGVRSKGVTKYLNDTLQEIVSR